MILNPLVISSKSSLRVLRLIYEVKEYLLLRFLDWVRYPSILNAKVMVVPNTNNVRLASQLLIIYMIE